MEFRDYWHMLRRRLWIPALLLVATLLIAAPLTFLPKPSYSATATVLAKNSGSLSFADVTTSNTVALKVISQLKLNEGVDHFTGRLSVTSGRSNIYKVSASDPDPRVATAIANAVAAEATNLYQQLATGSQRPAESDLERQRKSFQDQYLAAATALLDFNRAHPDAAGPNAHPKDPKVGAQALLLQLAQQSVGDAYMTFEEEVTRAQADNLSNAGGSVASVVDQAAPKPDTDSRILRMLYAAVLALVLGIGLIFALEYMDHSVRQPEEVEDLLGAPVLGIIPRGTGQTLRPAKGGAA